MAKSMQLGKGGRFAAMVASGKSPALAAYIGRKKYGAKKMAKWSGAGRHRAAMKRHHSTHSYHAGDLGPGYMHSSTMLSTPKHSKGEYDGCNVPQTYTKNQ